MSREAFSERLLERAHRSGLHPTADLVATLWSYYELLTRWNDRINLAGFPLRGYPDAALDRLLVEPLVAARLIGAVDSMIDIGSGGGSPAIPLALALGVGRLRMVESRTRKAVFLREATRAVGLSEAEVFAARIEALLTDPRLQAGHALVTIRAVRIEPGLLAQLVTLGRPGGRVALFRTAGGSFSLEGATVAPLDPEGRSELVVIEVVPRGTSGQQRLPG